MWLLCVTVPTVPHLYGLPLIAPRNDYMDEDLPDEDEMNAPVRAPASLIPSHTSRTPSSSPSPIANKSQALPQTGKSMAGWDICKRMCPSGWSGLEQASWWCHASRRFACSKWTGRWWEQTHWAQKAGEITMLLKISRCSLRARHQRATLQISLLLLGM